MTEQKTTLQIEQAFLSAAINGSPEFVEWVRDVITSDDFVIPGHGMIYDSMLAAHDATGGRDRSPSMIVSQAAKLRIERGKWEADGIVLATLEELGCGLEYLNGLKANWVNEDSGREYGVFIQDQADRRRLQNAATGIFSLATSDDPDYREKAEKLFAESVTPNDKDTIVDGADAVDAIWDGIRQTRAIPFRSVLTGIQPIDAFGLGLGAGKYYLIAGPTHDGKTQVCMATVFGAAYYSNALVVLFPYEQDWLELSCTVQAMFTGGQKPWVLNVPEPEKRTPVHKKRVMELSQPREQVIAQYKSQRRMGYDVRFVQPTEGELLELENAKTLMHRLGYKVEYAPGGIRAMRSTIRRIARNNPDRHIIAVLDYIQLAASGEDNYREINFISHQVKESAMKDKSDPKSPNPQVTWVVLSQFNRTNGTNALKQDVSWDTVPRDKMQLDALAESPALGQDPDFIMFLLQNERYMSSLEKTALGLDKKNAVKLSFSVMKNRIGTEYGDGAVWIYKANGMVSHKSDIDLRSQYVEIEDDEETD